MRANVLFACLLVALLPTAAARAGLADRDCSDFSTQAAAQSYFDSMGYGPGRDPERLDADNDGIACESNPCPCARPGAAPSPTPTGPYVLPAPTASPSPPPLPSTERPRSRSARVIRVIDGDTIRVRLGSGQSRTIRLIGIDAPEVSPARFGHAECGGREALVLMRRLAPVRARVRLVSDPSQDRVDRFGRWLRYVQRGGRDLGRSVIAAGWAAPYVFDAEFRRVGTYRAAARRAARARVGVHRRCGGRFHRPLRR